MSDESQSGSGGEEISDEELKDTLKFQVINKLHKSKKARKNRKLPAEDLETLKSGVLPDDLPPDKAKVYRSEAEDCELDIEDLEEIISQVEAGRSIPKSKLPMLRAAAGGHDGPHIPNESEYPGDHAAWLRHVAPGVIPHLEYVPAPAITDFACERALRDLLEAITVKAERTPEWLGSPNVFELLKLVGNANSLAVFHKPFMFAANDRTKRIYNQASFAPFGSIQDFFNFRPSGVSITVGLAIVWTEPYVKQNLTTWMDHFLHANVLVIIHPPPKTRGKHLLWISWYTLEPVFLPLFSLD
ncbi:hypothetical protein R3P38DRAFT_3282397 [Favolaschia claudopus]|uniref:Bystin n=1 Tax=Favolaschia claudopus TaxID=2862362 RepID=A0AAW0ACQ0_9AGAR